MHCIILAAGFATRLYPLTKNIPKALLPVKGRALIDYLIEDVLKQKEISQITLITNDTFFSLFKKHIQNAFPEKNIEVLNNKISDVSQKNGAIKDLLHVIETKNINEDILVFASDTYTSLKLQDLIRFYKQFKSITTAVFDGKDIERIRNKLGCMVIEKNKVISFIEKPKDPPSTLMAIPFYIIPHTKIPLISSYLMEGSADAPGHFISWAVKNDSVYSLNIGTGYYYDVGTIEQYSKITSS